MGMQITSHPRRIIGTVVLAMGALGGGVAANADDEQVVTGHCAKSFDVASPTTMTCSFQMSEASHGFSGGGWTYPQDGSVAAGWLLTMSVAGEPQPLNSCAGVLYSGCVTGTWSSDAYVTGTVVKCTVRAVGQGSFSCTSYRD